MIYFTSDEHYFHENIIKYANRPFECVNKMNNEMVSRFNSVVAKSDVTIHAGDFSLGMKQATQKIIKMLNGDHIFLSGDHDRWMKKSTARQIYSYRRQGFDITVCHYCLRVWPRSHYNSWHLYGHSHGKLPSLGKSLDIGVDTNDYYPYSIMDIERIMTKKQDNFNLIQTNELKEK